MHRGLECTRIYNNVPIYYQFYLALILIRQMAKQNSFIGFSPIIQDAKPVFYFSSENII